MSYRTEDSRKEFDSWSRRYDWDPLQPLLFQPSHRMLLEGLGPADRRVLDIGCGTGRFGLQVIERFPRTHVYGLDLSDGMLAQGARRFEEANGRLHRVQADSQQLPFADDTFDAVTCAHSFHHYPRQDQVVTEMFRVLRPGGLLQIVDGDRDRFWGHFIFDVVVVWFEGAVVHRSSRSMRKLLQEAGFGEIDQRRRRGPVPFLLTAGRAMKGPVAGSRVA